MIPILYDKDETVFTSNGLGRLRDCISCIVTEERNGIYECDFEYPITGAHYDEIQVGRIIGVTHDESGDIQPFDIVSYTRPIDGVVTFHCTHISYRQCYIVTIPAYGAGSINSLADAIHMITTWASPENPFSYWTDKTSTGRLGCATGMPYSVRAVLGGVEGSILDSYGGEYEWDKFTVKLWSSRGQTRDFTIRYGVNMLDYNEEYDIQGTYSSCQPYWTDGIQIALAPRVASTGQTITGRDQCVPLDLSDRFDEFPDTGQLQTAARAYMAANNPFIPKQNIHVEFARLQDIGYEEYGNLLKCNLCDTINVVFPEYNSTGQFKIVKTVWDVLADRYESMELGDLSVTLAEALGINSGGSVNDSRMADIIADLTYDSDVVTVYGNYCKCRRIGHVVQVWGESSNGWSIASGAYRALTTLGEGFRPPQNVRFVCGALGGTQQITGYVNTSGIVYLYTTETTGYWSFSITYLVG